MRQAIGHLRMPAVTFWRAATFVTVAALGFLLMMILGAK